MQSKPNADIAMALPFVVVPRVLRSDVIGDLLEIDFRLAEKFKDHVDFSAVSSPLTARITSRSSRTPRSPRLCDRQKWKANTLTSGTARNGRPDRQPQQLRRQVGLFLGLMLKPFAGVKPASGFSDATR